MRGANKNFIPLIIRTWSNLKIFKPIMKVIVVPVSFSNKCNPVFNELPELKFYS
jgi:hypothetical protein